MELARYAAFWSCITANAVWQLSRVANVSRVTHCDNGAATFHPFLALQGQYADHRECCSGGGPISDHPSRMTAEACV